MKNDIYCDVTEYMDKFRDPKQIPELAKYYYHHPDNSRNFLGGLIKTNIYQTMII